MDDSARSDPERCVHEGRIGLSGSFALRLGGRLSDATVDYASVGPDSAPTVVVLGGISANRHPSRWWGNVVGHGRALDVRRFRVLGIDWLGARPECFPSKQESAARAYPLISTHDQARAVTAALDELGVDAVHALVGASYGAMVGLAAAAEYPARFPRMLLLSGAHRAHPMATAHRALQRAILELARSAGREDEGVVLARALAMTTYRTVEEFERRFSPDPLPDTTGRFEVEEYLWARGRSFQERFSADSFAALSLSIDLHRMDPADVTARVDLVSVDSDQLTPTWLMDELEHRLAGPVRHHRMRSRWGHDAFLKETESVGRIVAGVLADGHAKTDERTLHSTSRR